MYHVVTVVKEQINRDILALENRLATLADDMAADVLLAEPTSRLGRVSRAIDRNDFHGGQESARSDTVDGDDAAMTARDGNATARGLRRSGGGAEGARGRSLASQRYQAASRQWNNAVLDWLPFFNADELREVVRSGSF